MPETSSDDTVYADPDVMAEYVQTDANQFSLDTTTSDGSVSQWRAFLERIQSRMKDRIDEYVDRPDFEDHPGDTRILDVGPTSSRILELPEPVRSITEVRVDDTPVDPGSYRWKESGQLIRIDPTDSTERAVWPAGYGNIEVDLDWGYQTPPEDVVEAELKLVGNTVSGLAQMREGMIVQQDDIDVSVNFPEAMTPEIKNMLRNHRSGGRTMGVL